MNQDQYYKISRLKEAIDAEQLLLDLGFQIYKTTSREVRCACKVHGGDNRSAFKMNKETKNWVCFSHGCHEDAGYDVIGLVKKVKNFSFAEAIGYLENLAGIDITDEAAYLQFKREKDRKRFIDQMIDNKQVPSALLTEEYLRTFKKFRSAYFEQEENGGFPKEILDEFEVGGGYIDRYGFQRDVIPIRDINSTLKAYSCRDITDRSIEEMKYLLTKSFDKDKVLYNLNKAKEYIKESNGVVIVVEGFKSVWRLSMAGYKNVVACMGSSITGGQQSILYGNASEVILLLDMDKAGVKGVIRSLEDMHRKIRIKPLYLPYVDTDPADYSVNDIRKIIGGYYEQKG